MFSMYLGRLRFSLRLCWRLIAFHEPGAGVFPARRLFSFVLVPPPVSQKGNHRPESEMNTVLPYEKLYDNELSVYFANFCLQNGGVKVRRRKYFTPLWRALTKKVNFRKSCPVKFVILHKELDLKTTYLRIGRGTYIQKSLIRLRQNKISNNKTKNIKFTCLSRFFSCCPKQHIIIQLISNPYVKTRKR